MNKIVEVCLSPALLPYYNLKSKIVVVIDIFRATSSICYGIENGAYSIIPVASIEECKSFEGQGYLLAAERNGEVVSGFDFGNSPFSYSKEKVKGKTIVLTTTNGTNAIQLSQEAEQIIIGSFLNLDPICNYLIQQNKDIILLCAGWKNKFNLEDTLFAGAVVSQLRGSFQDFCDSAIAAEDLYYVYQNNLISLLEKSSHSQRLKDLHIEEDIAFCLKLNICQSIPVLKEGKLVALK